MDRNERDETRPDEGEQNETPQRKGHAKDWEREVEAVETDGRGTGGVGEDAGGYEPLPEPD
jgi:hypothetical protein